jgi:DNA-nicking Smr family endonuclease
VSHRDYDDGDADSFLRAGQQKDVLRKLRKSQPSERDELDLHGFTVATSKPELEKFIRSSQRSDGQCTVLVIHGQGRGSPEGRSVLKSRVRRWLQEQNAVLAYCAAGPGAVKVLLKRK